MRLLCFCLLWSCLSGHLSGVERPNVILMMADDLGWGDTGFNGNTIIHTPCLDQMAADGMVLTRFYAASAVCSPTRGSCLTGRHPSRLGIPNANTGHLKPGELTLAELLRDQGYATGHFGKWHLGTLTTKVADSNRGGPRGAPHFSPPWKNGFDICFSTEAKVPTYDPMLQPPGKTSGQVWDFIKEKSTAASYGTRYWNERGEEVKDNLSGDDSRVIMDRAIPFIQKAAKDQKPFFAVIWFHSPHLPVVAGPEHVKPYAQYDAYHQNYYGCVSALDEQVGRLRKTLRESNIAGKTLLFFASDNGPEGKSGSAPGSAGKFRGRKRDLFEGGIRVPAIVEWQGRVKPGGRSDFPSVTSDYLPTVLDLIGRPPPDDRPFDGISLVLLIDGKATTRGSPICFAFGKQTALSDNRWKLIRPGGGKPAELYDLLEDPSEKTDLASMRQDLVKQLDARLGAWIGACQAP